LDVVLQLEQLIESPDDSLLGFGDSPWKLLEGNLNQTSF
jgi:hypothetical protein